MSYDAGQIDVEELQSEAIRSDLSEDEEKRVLAPLGFLATRSGTLSIDRADGASFHSNERRIQVPSGTLHAVIYPFNWFFNYGSRPNIIERPISQMGLFWGITKFEGTEVTVKVQALLRDINGDDPWWSDFSFVVMCFG